MLQQFNLLQVIELLNEDKSLIFQRVNDENFIIYRDDIGRLMCKIKNNSSRTLNIFNYMQDLWVEKGLNNENERIK